MATSSPRDRVTLHGMRFHARAGVYPHEATLPQPIEVDLSVEIDPAGVPTSVVDYGVLYATVAEVLGGGHIGYLEEIAERIAGRVLTTPGVHIAHVTVRKPHVTLPGPLAYAEVAITRARSGA